MKAFHRAIFVLAALTFARTALPPGNADLISLQLQAFDLSHGTTEFLYPGKDFAGNEAWVAHHERSMRALGTQGEPNWCFYPPLLAFLLQPLAAIHPEVWRLSWAAIQSLAIFALFQLSFWFLQQAKLSVNKLLLLSLFLSYPIARSVELGQTSILIALCIWLAVKFAEQKPLLSSLTLGLAAFVKPFVAVAGLAKKRGAVKTLLFTVLTAGLLLSINVLAVGWESTANYVDFLSTLSRSYTTYSGNQSLLAGFLRFASIGPVTDYGFAQHEGIATLAKLILAMLLSMTFIAYTRSRESHPVSTATLWLSAILLALPITWEHHFVLLLPGLAFSWAAATSRRNQMVLAVITTLICCNWTWLYNDDLSGRLAANLPLAGNLLFYIYLIRERFHYRKATELAVSN